MTIVIPSKTIGNLTACVGAIRARENPRDVSVVVIDDGLQLEPRHPVLDGVLILPGIKPFVYARNCNRGILAADPDDVILLNDDAMLHTPGGFSALAKFAKEHPEVGCVAPATNVTGQPLQWPKHRTPEGFRYVDTVPYVCVYIPRRTLDTVGLLDERYCLDYGCEDLDHTEAMKRAGLKIAVLYDVYVDHGSLRSSFRGDPRAPKSFAKNLALFKQKWSKTAA